MPRKLQFLNDIFSFKELKIVKVVGNIKPISVLLIPFNYDLD